MLYATLRVARFACYRIVSCHYRITYRTHTHI